jgi:hypothetical protein
MAVFAPVGSSQITASFTGAANPTIANVPMASAATEYSYALPTNTRQFLIKSRSGAALQVAYVAGDSGLAFVTVNRGCFYGESDLTLGGIVLYFQSPEAAQTAEIVSWV